MATSSTISSDVLSALNGSSSSSSSSSTSSTADTKNQFLTLLTTQLQNQDPLNPMDNAQMTSQLAQISTVDGITKLNSTLQTLLDNTSATQAVQSAGLIGKGVLVPGSGLSLSSSQAAGGFELAGNADVVKLTIKDSNGAVVRTVDLGSKQQGMQTFTWDGKNDAGAVAADGNYTFSIDATQGTSSIKATNLQLGAVGSISGKGSSMTINVTGVGSFAMSDIREII
ncbi:MAG TPA: flagellar hook assembly protein FlgD [Rhodocyclaceae bacterium]|jgi:flagellar basal-body rod modification protein FlgD